MNLNRAKFDCPVCSVFMKREPRSMLWTCPQCGSWFILKHSESVDCYDPAAKAYDAAARKRFKEFAKLNLTVQ